MRILAIESSCDESAAAYLAVEKNGAVSRFDSVVATQAIHAMYGGVVPEVAAREHAVTLPLVLAEMARKIVGVADGAKLGAVVDVVAVTRGPGLVTSLKVGVDTARALAIAWKKPLIGVNHIYGHVAAAWLPGAPLEASLRDKDKGVFPALVLVVSGGHTELLHMTGHGKFKLLGATRDDAAGEAFDKTAKLMGLGYPGGPAISKLAAQGDPHAFAFPRPMMADLHDDFSFSGLKTAVRYFLDERQDQLANDDRFRADVAASAEGAIVEVLVTKTVRAARRLGVKTVMVAGGVAANKKLRSMLATAVADKLPGVRFVEPPLAYCTDNAAMIAMAAYFTARGKKFDDAAKMDVDSGWELGRVGRGRGPVKKKAAA